MKQTADEKNILSTYLASRGVGAEAASACAAKMLAFEDLVLERNESVNLTAITERGEFLTKHLIDSCSCVGWSEIESAVRVADVGTGAGFPGIPLAILYPKKEFVLIDSLGKRVQFIEEAAASLRLTNVKAIHMRAEDAGRDADMRESFDLCITRAVAALSILAEYCLPLVRVGGALYAYKTKRAEEELIDAETAISLLGGRRKPESRAVSLPPAEMPAVPQPANQLLANDEPFYMTGERRPPVSPQPMEQLHPISEPFYMPGQERSPASPQPMEQLHPTSEPFYMPGQGRSPAQPAEQFLATGSTCASGDLPLSRRIFIIQKERPTPPRYPRRAGIPAKVPL